MTKVERVCPVCGEHPAGRPLEAYAAHHLRRCPACGCAFVDVVPTQLELDEYYGDYPIKEGLSPITVKRYEALLHGFERSRLTGHLIDVGCGGGGFLVRAARRGWCVHGTEYGSNVVEDLRRKGIAMQQGALNVAEHEADGYDVVVSLEVLEHVIDPMRELEAMHRILRPGGLLYITTPNFNALTRHFSGGKWTIVNYPEHLTLLTPRSLHRLLTKAGFQRISLHTTGASLSRFKESHHIGDADANRTAADDEALRRSIEASWFLRVAKGAVNALLDATRSGDSLKALYRKPGRRDVGT